MNRTIYVYDEDQTELNLISKKITFNQELLKQRVDKHFNSRLRGFYAVGENEIEKRVFLFSRINKKEGFKCYFLSSEAELDYIKDDYLLFEDSIFSKNVWNPFREFVIDNKGLFIDNEALDLFSNIIYQKGNRSVKNLLKMILNSVVETSTEFPSSKDLIDFFEKFSNKEDLENLFNLEISELVYNEMFLSLKAFLKPSFYKKDIECNFSVREFNFEKDVVFSHHFHSDKRINSFLFDLLAYKCLSEKINSSFVVFDLKNNRIPFLFIEKYDYLDPFFNLFLSLNKNQNEKEDDVLSIYSEDALDILTLNLNKIIFGFKELEIDARNML